MNSFEKKPVKKAGPLSRVMGRLRFSRDAPTASVKDGASFLTSVEGWEVLCGSGYRPFNECTEVQACIGVFADLIGSMTIRLMRNGEHGDERVRDGLSYRVDIAPSRYMTRIAFIQCLVRTLMTNGNCVVYPEYDRAGLLVNLKLLPPHMVSFIPRDDGYVILYQGRELNPDTVLHFVLNPDPDQPWHGTGYRVSLRDAVDGIRQAEATRQKLLKFPAPSIIVKVDGLVEEFSSVEGRKKLRAQYLDSSEAAEPWFIPAEAFAVEQVKPLTISDLAIRENLELDKRAVAAIFGVPPFMVGVGAFNREEYRNFINTRVLAVAKIIEQELTRKLLYSPDLYFKFSNMSLYSYDLSELVAAGSQLVDRMAIRRNELRDWLGLSPDSAMDELLALENYLPVSRLGDQKKLNGSDNDGSDTDQTDPDA
jgi:HK97 family phage portal protein